MAIEDEVKQPENKSYRNYRDIVAKVISVSETHIQVREMDGTGTFISLTQTLFPPYKQSVPEEIQVDQVIGVKICKERYWSPKYNEWKVVNKFVGVIDILG